jgi:hypothetical protein
LLPGFGGGLFTKNANLQEFVLLIPCESQENKLVHFAKFSMFCLTIQLTYKKSTENIALSSPKTLT